VTQNRSKKWVLESATSGDFFSLEIKIKEITSYKYIGIAAKLSRD